MDKIINLIKLSLKYNKKIIILPKSHKNILACRRLLSINVITSFVGANRNLIVTLNINSKVNYIKHYYLTNNKWYKI